MAIDDASRARARGSRVRRRPRQCWPRRSDAARRISGIGGACCPPSRTLTCRAARSHLRGSIFAGGAEARRRRLRPRGLNPRTRTSGAHRLREFAKVRARSIDCSAVARLPGSITVTVTVHATHHNKPRHHRSTRGRLSALGRATNFGRVCQGLQAILLRSPLLGCTVVGVCLS